MALLTEGQELYSEVQDWATSIFGSSKARKKAAAKRGPAAAPDAWPSVDQQTPALAQALDAAPIKRRATHTLRAGIRNAFAWADALDNGDVDEQSAHAAEIANAAVVAHTPTSGLRSILQSAREWAGVWEGFRSGRLKGSIAVRATSSALNGYGQTMEPHVTAAARRQWKAWAEELAARGDDIMGNQPTATTSKASLPDVSQTPVTVGFDTLRPYQKAAFSAITEAHPSNCCVVLPCGAGKTKVGASVAVDFLYSNPEGVAIVLCLRREGVRQWAQELRAAWGTEALEVTGRADMGAVRSSRIMLVTYHRMLAERRRHLQMLREFGVDSCGLVANRFLAAPCGVLIADECHMVPAPSIGDLLQSLLGTARRIVGLTATLLREGMENCEAPWPILGECVHRETFTQLAPEYLAPVRCIEVRVPVLCSAQTLFKSRPLAAAVCLARGKWEVLEHLLAKHAEDSLLITVERCEQARQIASAFGILPIDGSIPATQIQDYLARFRARKILALVATHVLDDSADFPELTVMVQMGGHFASRRQEQQRLGRLLRWGPVKKQRWKEYDAKPTFYVLVHEGTVEERMCQHRSSSVTGVQYERMTAKEVCARPFSPLSVSSLFPSGVGFDAFGKAAALDEFRTCAAAATKASKAMDSQIAALAKKISTSLPGGRVRAGAPDQDQMVALRKWLRGGDLELRRGNGDEGTEAMELEDDGEFEDDFANCEAEQVEPEYGTAKRHHAALDEGDVPKKRRLSPHSGPSVRTEGGGAVASSSSSSASSSSSSSTRQSETKAAVKPRSKSKSVAKGSRVSEGTSALKQGAEATTQESLEQGAHSPGGVMHFSKKLSAGSASLAIDLD